MKKKNNSEEFTKYYLACVDLCNKINWLECFNWFLSVNQELQAVYHTTLYKIEKYCDINSSWELSLADLYVERLDYVRYTYQQVDHDKSEEISKLIKEKDDATKKIIQTEKLINEMLEQYPSLKERYDRIDFLPF